ncbi:testis-specific Y-encoded protein 3-like [Nycticebus coucang]|uniref:testis-specific Y-encoded protein 3-like n=1 Tax=Nycticebus coucang TaxID=9470 RepID=UPI00234CC139|nr:testis-specific Y-encoded protein 3-like [Nycticebus coucang]
MDDIQEVVEVITETDYEDEWEEENVQVGQEEDVQEKEEDNEREEKQEKERGESESEKQLQAEEVEKTAQSYAGNCPTTSRQALEALEVLQLGLEPVNARASRAHARLKRSLCQRRKAYLDHRRAVIQGIPGFWAKVFVNHPQMSILMSNQDEGILHYMTNLEVEELRNPSGCCKIILFFWNNPYFSNKVISKEYFIEITGWALRMEYRASYSTPIQWYQDYELKAYSRRHHNSSLNFFNWFSDHNVTESYRIAEIIIKDLWLNPLYYYRRIKAPGEETETPASALPKILPAAVKSLWTNSENGSSGPCFTAVREELKSPFTGSFLQALVPMAWICAYRPDDIAFELLH